MKTTGRVARRHAVGHDSTDLPLRYAKDAVHTRIDYEPPAAGHSRRLQKIRDIIRKIQATRPHCTPDRTAMWAP